ncbi:RNA polymerase sigma-70 factor (ECF subfamily) [Dysgonomonas hofstadii]|uniref:RNA polymerase sigma-70 factor (ECF subfamily) n=1 Tax=Dysgonomonas hofstadii TaxID=637886 RepID=A0A840CQA7_9BACT|nr:RNA polymerase sigma-70 factor [Dysgonomonas hofstadii]MBB4038287.1 RNA polymerase sigma-70 factor (ECF subfamily) [Dysgonomonas hofstadii]
MQIENTDIKQFSSIFLENRSRFVNFAASYLRDEAIAEDIVMESFLYYWENRDSLDNIVNIPAYILVIVKHKSLNYLRNQSSHRKIENNIKNYQERLLQENIVSLEACDPQYLFSDEVQQIIDSVLISLPEKTREIFIRSRFKSQSYKEIASELSITEKSVEFNISKALKIFRVALRDYFPVFLYLLHFH